MIQITDMDRRTWFETARELYVLHAKANDVDEMVQTAFGQVQLLQHHTCNHTLATNVKQDLDNVIKEFEAARCSRRSSPSRKGERNYWMSSQLNASRSHTQDGGDHRGSEKSRRQTRQRSRHRHASTHAHEVPDPGTGPETRRGARR